MKPCGICGKPFKAGDGIAKARDTSELFHDACVGASIDAEQMNEYIKCVLDTTTPAFVREKLLLNPAIKAEFERRKS